jgi:hypothetical protein
MSSGGAARKAPCQGSCGVLTGLEHFAPEITPLGVIRTEFNVFQDARLTVLDTFWTLPRMYS